MSGRVLFAVLATGLLGACTSDDGAPGSSAAGAGPSAGGALGGMAGAGVTMASGGAGRSSANAGAAAGSDGCSKATKPDRGHYSLEVGSVERGYYLIPSASDEPVPLVFEFHGRGSDGEGIISSFGLETSLNGHVVLVAPDGLDQGGGTGWASGNDNEDIELTRALIEQAMGEHCIDASRIYAVGFSWGGWMATQAACALGASLAGFVSVEGGGPMGSACAGAVAGMVVHGTMDTAEPISSGIATRDAFRTLDGCGDTLGASAVPGCEACAGCEKPLLWCQHDGAHLIPDFVVSGLPGFFALAP